MSATFIPIPRKNIVFVQVGGNGIYRFGDYGTMLSAICSRERLDLDEVVAREGRNGWWVLESLDDYTLGTFRFEEVEHE